MRVAAASVPAVDAGGFEEFFHVMHPKLVRYAKRRLDPDTALDVASQAMHTIWTKEISNPESEAESRQLQSLAYRIVEGHIRNALRSHRRFARVLDAVAETRRHPDVVSDVADVVVDGGPAAWLDKLSLTDREVLSLLGDGYTVSEIAVILDCTPAAVSMRLQRARKNLKLVLGRVAQDD